MEHLGELAALGAAACWATSAIAFATAGERIGSLSVNLVRLCLGLAFLTATQWLLRGQALPTDATAHAWGWLALSGLVGFTFGDLCLFRALVVIGPRLSSLLMSLAPPFTAVTGWIFLGEQLSLRDIMGMTLTVGGVAWAITAREPSGPKVLPSRTPRERAIGVLLGVGGALGQAVGLVLTKHGMGSYDPFAATQIRLVAGLAGFVLLFFALGWWPRVRAAVRDRRSMGHTAVGAFFGSFLGVGLSLVAVQNTLTGVAATIMATTPILIIPLAWWLRREGVGVGGLGGALLAVAGVALLFW